MKVKITMSIVLTLATTSVFAQTPPGADNPNLLSAYLGGVDTLAPGQLAAVSGCDQVVGDEGMPVVTEIPVDPDEPLSPRAFLVITESGQPHRPTCATLEPASDPDENRTILLTGPMGDADDLPVSVVVIGDVITVDGRNLRGAHSRVTLKEEGTSMVLAEAQPADAICTSLGSTAQLLLTFEGGVTGPRGAVPGADELADFTLFDAEGRAFDGLGFDDLQDGDNHLVLCVPGGVNPTRVRVEADTLFDPTNNPNPESEVPVS
ncbi:MAG: hypothetical protein AAFX94_23990, partial [Myxococcota bacterium]